MTQSLFLKRLLATLYNHEVIDKNDISVIMIVIK